MNSRPPDPARFDIGEIEDAGIKIQYQTLDKRFHSLARQLETNYGLRGARIDFEFVKDDHFNASVELTPDSYQVRVSAAVPILLMILFDKLLTHPGQLPWLSREGEGEVSYETPFSVDTRNLERRRDWSVETNKIRAFASGTLSEIAASFVFLHELGHILNGHLLDLAAAGRPARHSEFNMVEPSGEVSSELDQLREFQADAVGAALVANITEELIENVACNSRTAAVFGPAEMAAENCISLTVIALYGLFAYVRGQQRKLNLRASHPDPLVRSIYVRDYVFQAMRQRRGFNAELAQDMLQARFDEMNAALKSVELIAPHTVTPAGVRRATALARGLTDLQREYGASIARFAFIEWSA